VNPRGGALFGDSGVETPNIGTASVARRRTASPLLQGAAERASADECGAAPSAPPVSDPAGPSKSLPGTAPGRRRTMTVRDMEQKEQHVTPMDVDVSTRQPSVHAGASPENAGCDPARHEIASLVSPRGSQQSLLGSCAPLCPADACVQSAQLEGPSTRDGSISSPKPHDATGRPAVPSRELRVAREVASTIAQDTACTRIVQRRRAMPFEPLLQSALQTVQDKDALEVLARVARRRGVLPHDVA
jgi:hypothetical protein